MVRLIVTTKDGEIFVGTKKEMILDKEKELQEFLKNHLMDEEEVNNVGFEVF